MKRFAVAAVLWLAVACGKVGDPQPPFIRIPLPVADLTVQQSAYRAELSWTNPLRYVDGSTATDLATVHVLRDGAHLQSIEVGPPGQRQSFTVPIADVVGIPQTFAVQVETRRGRLSEVSNLARLLPIDTPGTVRNLTAIVDQNRIEVSWQPPERNGQFANVYIVRREDQPAPHVVAETHWTDAEFDTGKHYSYTVTAARGSVEASVPGEAGVRLAIDALDKTPPATPRGVTLNRTDNAAVLTWEPNAESDLAGYLIYRGDRPDGTLVQLQPRPRAANNFEDRDYRPGAYYKISAVDISGNESEKSLNQDGP